MLYFITDYKNKIEKYELEKLGVFCYDLRHSKESWNDITTIENNVLIDRYGCLITNEKLEIGNKYPNDYLDFKEFAIKNNKVNHFEDLKCGWKEKLLLDFSDKNNLKIVMETLFSKVDIGDTFYELSNEEKIQKILKEYNSTYRIIYKNIDLYQLYEKIEEEESC